MVGAARMSSDGARRRWASWWAWGIAKVAAAMRAAGVAPRLDKGTVQGWLSGASCAHGMPAWLSELMAAVEAAEREAGARAEAVEAEHRRLLAEERVQAGRRRFRGGELEVVEEWALDTAKDLVRTDGEVSDLGAAVLAAVGVRTDGHPTWPIHRGGGDGLTGTRCEARIGELAAQRFAQQQGARHERRDHARRDAERLASGAFVVGQQVLAHDDSRAAVVTKINRVTVKVKHGGGRSDRYQLVERNHSPAYLHSWPDKRATVLCGVEPGQSVVFGDWRRRARTGEIRQTDGPPLQVAYRLASGRARTACIDVLCLVAGGRS